MAQGIHESNPFASQEGMHRLAFEYVCGYQQNDTPSSSERVRRLQDRDLPLELYPALLEREPVQGPTLTIAHGSMAQIVVVKEGDQPEYWRLEDRGHMVSVEATPDTNNSLLSSEDPQAVLRRSELANIFGSKLFGV